MEMINNVTTSPVPANLLTSIRAVTNLFKSSCYYPWLQNHRSEVSMFLLTSLINSLQLTFFLSFICVLPFFFLFHLPFF